MSAVDDRRVHASLHGRLEVVRYDRSGKWYREYAGRKHGRLHIGFAEAVKIALSIEQSGGEVFLGLPGGKAFDGLLTRRRKTLHIDGCSLPGDHEGACDT